mgnify:CR=1 FL=1|jgi:hypothetical protein
MKKVNSTDYIKDLLRKINLVKDCIKENTNIQSMSSEINQTLKFQTKENIQIEIRLYP